MADKADLRNKEFIGTVLPDKDNKHRGKYLVHIHELQPHRKPEEGIWVKNSTHKNRISPSEVGICGTYYPLQPGMSVIIKFFTNHLDSGYVDRVISDAYPETLPYEIIERDDYYQIIRTPKHNNLIAIFEGSEKSKNIPKNSIHIYFNDMRSVLVIDEEGVHIITADNVNIKSAKTIKIEAIEDINITAGRDIKMQANGNINIISGKKLNQQSVSDTNIKVGAKFNQQAAQDINIKAGAKLNEQAAQDINIKAGAKLNEQAAQDINIKTSGGSINEQAATNISLKSTASNFIESAMNHFNGTNIGQIPVGRAGTALPAADAADANDPIDATESDKVVVTDLITDSDYKYFKQKSGE